MEIDDLPPITEEELNTPAPLAPEVETEEIKAPLPSPTTEKKVDLPFIETPYLGEEKTLVAGENEAARIARRRSELGDVSFAEAIWGTHNSIAAEFLQGGEKHFETDPNFAIGADQIGESGLPMLLIQQGIEDGSINSQEGWEDFVARNEQAREYHEVLADYGGATKFIGGIIPSIVDPYNAADIAFTAGLAALPAVGWGALAVRASLAGVTGGASAYFSEKSIQQSNASYDNEALELATWLGAGIGAATYGVGNALITKRSYNNGGIDPVEGQAIVDSVTGEYRVLKDGDLKKSTETPYYDVGNWWSISIAGQMKKSLSNAARQFAYRLDVSGADSGKYLNTEETARSMMFQFEKAGGSLLQGLNGERVFHKLDHEAFSKKVNDAYADFINKGKDLNKVPDDMKESIKQYHAYNEYIKSELKSIGVPVKDDYFRHSWNIEEVLRSGELKFKADFKVARRAKVTTELSNVTKIIDTLKKQIEEVGRFKKGEKVTITNMDGTKTVHTTGQRTRLLNMLRKRLKRAEEGSIRKGEEKGWREVTKEMVEEALEKESSGVWKSLASKDPSDRFFLNVSSKRSLPEIDESLLKNYFHADISSAVVSNSRFLAGRVATKKRFGFSDEKGLKEYIEKLGQEALEAGDSKKFVDKFKRNAEMSVKNLWNTQMTPDNPNGTANLVTQFVLKTNTIAMGLSFGSTALASEGVTMFTRGTLQAGFKSIGMGMKELKNTIKGVPADSRAYRQQQILMGAFEVLDHKTYDRYLIGDDLADGGNKLLRAATAVQSAVMKASMLAPITQNIRIALGHVKLDDMFNMDFAKLSAKDKKHYTRMQFDYNDIKRMQDFKEKVTLKDKDGEFNGYDFTKLPPDLARSIDRYMGNLSRHDVILGERIHMPALFSSNNAYSKLLTQYLSFPAQAYESLLLKGIQEADARLATATMFQLMAISTMAMAREEMEIKAGLKHELDRKYTFDEEGFTALATHGMLKNSYLAPLTFAADTVSKAFTGQSLNSDYRQYNAMSAFGGVSAGRLQTTYEALTKLGLDYTQYGGTGWNTSYGRAIAANGLLPAVYAPGMINVFNQINHDMEYGN